MAHDRYADQDIARILRDTKTIALVGASANPLRPSHGVMRFLLGRGYKVIPVNPGLAGKEIHGQLVFENLAAISQPIDMVDVFRNSFAVPGLIDEILELQTLPKCIWMQLGVFDLPSAQRAEAAGIEVIMNRCPAIEIPRLHL